MNKLKNQGFSLTEMALTLAIVGTLSTLTYNYYARTRNDQKRINEGIQLNDFNKAIGNFLTKGFNTNPIAVKAPAIISPPEPFGMVSFPNLPSSHVPNSSTPPIIADLTG